ncbi:Protein FAM214A [Frankliniella fusca]|uniref:Protein FAM214A n=1 Tax=Frankliniella fusca TaxID=407009 RepID=A0AAE1HM19_9NEOP|nr:Protein FAM214A [Frankliniella fusca]
MHSMMEGEGGSEPQDVFVELGTLIVEGRVPGVGNARGYSEGPHCSLNGLSNGTSRHSCNPQHNLLCKRADSFRKHMQYMFQNNFPMCIEVLLCPDCPCGALKAQSTDVSNVPCATDILLEQWTITFNSRTSEPAPMLARGLVQAVRSQLHFSQLSAWWSSSKGSHPSNISYRLTVPGQVFASQFSRPPCEHTFPLASVGKSGSIKVCARSLPRMELVPTIHCPVHSKCLTTSLEVGEKACLSKPCLSVPETACGSSVTMVGSGDSGEEAGKGESCVDSPQRLRSPPRASEAPDSILYRCFPPEVVGARWQPDAPADGEAPIGMLGRLWKRDCSPCVSSNLCPRAAETRSRRQANEPGQDKHCGPSGLLDDRMLMECNMPGKHRCSCEVEEEIEEVKSPVQVRQRRRSQVSMPTSSSDSMHFASCNSNDGVANESTKRSSGLAVMADEYLYTSGGLAGNGNNSTGSLKRRRPVVDAVEAPCTSLHAKTWIDAENSNEASEIGSCFSGTNCYPVGTPASASGGSMSFNLSPSKGATAPIQALLSQEELKDVLTVLRDRSKSNARPNFFSLSSVESTHKLKEVGDCSGMSDSSHQLFRTSLLADIDQKSHKTDSLLDVALHSVGSVCQCNTVCQTPCKNSGKETDEAKLRVFCEKGKMHCDKIWSDMRSLNTAKGSVFSEGQLCFGTNACKSSNDLSEDHNNQVFCDKYTSLYNCDSGDNCLCLSCVCKTQARQTKEDNTNNSQNLSSEISGAPVFSQPTYTGLKKQEVKSPRHSTNDALDAQKDFLNNRQDVPSASERARFRRSFDSAASMVFHTRTGLPLTSSPAPVRRGTTRFDYDSSLNSVSAIRCALFDTPTITTQMEDSLSLSSDDTESESGARSPCSPDAGITFPSMGPCHALSPCFSLLGSFEESVLNGRLEPVSTVQGFTAEIGASGSFCPRHLKLPVTVFFYTLGDYDKVSTPYLGHINLGKKGYNVPRSGTIQVTLFNPMGTVIKMFVVMYDLTDMPPNSHTFLRQRTLYMPTGTEVSDDFPESDLTQKWLRYLIHLRFSSSKSGRVYLHTDVRMIIFRKSDMDTASVHNNNNVDSGFELRSYTNGPVNPKFSPR